MSGDDRPGANHALPLQQALEIRAIEVTDSTTGDAPMLHCLLEQMSSDEALASVIGDGAYDTKRCHGAIAQRQTPAMIPLSQERYAAISMVSPRARTPLARRHQITALIAQEVVPQPGASHAQCRAISQIVHIVNKRARARCGLGCFPMKYPEHDNTAGDVHAGNAASA